MAYQTEFDKIILTNKDVKNLCVTDYQHSIAGAGANNYQYKPCSGSGAFDFSDPVITGINITDGYSVEKVATGSTPDRLPFTGVKEIKDGTKRIKAYYYRDVLHGSMIIFDGLEVIEERVYNNGVLIQQIFYTPTGSGDVVGKFVWIYSYANPSTSCFTSLGSNAPCKESISSGPNIAGVFNNNNYSLTLQTEEGTKLMVRNPSEVIYYFNDYMIAHCTIKNNKVLGIVKCYDKKGLLSTYETDGNIPTWTEIKDLFDKK